MDFKSMVKDENVWISNEEMHNIPGAIQKEYLYLKENVQKDDICGALFRLKDIYEISMKIPAIMAVLSISSYMKVDDEFIRKTNDQLKLEQSNYTQGKKDEIEEYPEASKRFRLILSRLLREPLSIGSWSELIEIIVAYSALFELDSNLVTILSRTIHLFEVKPQKVNGEDGRYANVINWRNKTIGHGTLLLNTDDYWEQAYDLVKGLYTYFSEDAEGVSLNACYERIYITREEDDKYILQIGDKRLTVSKYIYNFDDEHYFFDSYYSKQKYTEVTNYFAAPKRLKDDSYYQRLYHHFIADEKISRPKKKGRLITNSADREMYACLNSIPDYERPAFVIDEIKKFINENNKGVIYIQMERGMGKSTLAHRLDGRYQKGILQKDLNAVVRVYHISNMRLRVDERKQDFFTALNTNLISYDGGQFEVDNKEYENSDRKDLRQLVETDTEDAQVAFSQYLELFRCRYEEELYGDTVSDEINLVYIIDGIDELDSDTKSILHAIPSDDLLRELPEETVNHVYIVLLSRTKEENLPDAAKECVDISEQKAGRVYTVDSNNEAYIALLKKYVRHNYKGISETACEDIIERAQRKFLYVQPYMALGDAILKTGEKLTACEVAENYVTELKKMYHGVSSNTLQLIISAIAVFRSISLKEICNLVLFTDVSYDVIGVLNDILPLLAVRRTDGDDVYEFANEGYEQYVLSKLRESVCEVICRFRISVNSWRERTVPSDGQGERAVIPDGSYGKEWGSYIKKILYVDSLAKEIHFKEIDEEYVKSLCDLWRTDPCTVYSGNVSEPLEVNVIDHLKALNYKELTVITKADLEHIGLEFGDCRPGASESEKKLIEYTQGMTAHCMKNPQIDIWFEFLLVWRWQILGTSKRDIEERLLLFRKIIMGWPDKQKVVRYLCNEVMTVYEKYCLDVRNMPDGKVVLYALYLEELLSFVKEIRLKKSVYEGLLYAYKLLVMDISKTASNLKKNEDLIWEKILKIVKEAAEYQDLPNYALIYDITKMYLYDEDFVDKKISELEDLSGKIHDFSAVEYYRELFHRLLLEKKKINEKQLVRYIEAEKLNISAVMDYLKNTYDGNNADDIFPWLVNFPVIEIRSLYRDDESVIILGLLDLYESLVKVYAEKSDADKLYCLHQPYKDLLELYDEIFRRDANIGLYNRVWSRAVVSYMKIIPCYEPVDFSLKMTPWEKTYTLYCSTAAYPNTFRKMADMKKIPCLPNVFINKLLQELYDEKEYEKYCSLNDHIRQTCSRLERIDDREYLLVVEEYYGWLNSCNSRSLEGKDSLTPDVLRDRLIEEYNSAFAKLLSLLNNGDDILNISSWKSDITEYIKFIAGLNKIFTLNSITLLNDCDINDILVEKLEKLRKKYSDQEKIIEQIDIIIQRIVCRPKKLEEYDPLELILSGI